MHTRLSIFSMSSVSRGRKGSGNKPLPEGEELVGVDSFMEPGRILREPPCSSAVLLFSANFARSDDFSGVLLWKSGGK